MTQRILDLFISIKDGEYLLKPVGYLCLIILFLLLLIATTFGNKKGKKIKTKQLIFCSMSITLATITSFIKFASLPMGGSITLFSMFFICFIGYLYGVKIGLITGIAYGILQFVIEPYIYHPIQILLDYPLAFGLLGLSGFFYKSKHGLLLGTILGILGRYFCHVISGYVFFRSSVPSGQNPVVYTLLYNTTYILPELIATVVLLCIPTMVKALRRVKQLSDESI